MSTPYQRTSNFFLSLRKRGEGVCRADEGLVRHYGLTLIELLVGLLILTILIWLCLPLGLAIIQRNQLQIMENEMTTAVSYARNMALLHKLPLTLTPLPNSKDWSSGMILFVDNKNHQYTEKDKLIHQWQWFHHGVQVIWQGFRSPHYLIFSSELQHAATSGHFEIKVDHAGSAKLVLNRFGRVVKKTMIG
jgi:prepilin-type N-terminal cleavage/methylation domain-containing protein